MDDMSPRISIISPCLNGMAYLPQSIASAQAQTLTDWELLLVDDGSDDGSHEWALAMAEQDPRIVPLRTTGRTGASRARNFALERARGRFVAFLDCDDWWHPLKLQRQMAALGPGRAAFCCGPYHVCDAIGRPQRLQTVDAPLTARRYLHKQFVIGCLTVLVDTSLVGQFRFPDHLHKAEDFVVWYDLLRRSEQLGMAAVSTADPLAYYRVHGGGQSHSKLQHAAAHWQIYSQELGLSLPMALRCFLAYGFNGMIDRLRRPVVPR